MRPTPDSIANFFKDAIVVTSRASREDDLLAKLRASKVSARGVARILGEKQLPVDAEQKSVTVHVNPHVLGGEFTELQRTQLPPYLLKLASEILRRAGAEKRVSFGVDDGGLFDGSNQIAITFTEKPEVEAKKTANMRGYASRLCKILKKSAKIDGYISPVFGLISAKVMPPDSEVARNFLRELTSEDFTNDSFDEFISDAIHDSESITIKIKMNPKIAENNSDKMKSNLVRWSRRALRDSAEANKVTIDVDNFENRIYIVTWRRNK